MLDTLGIGNDRIGQAIHQYCLLEPCSRWVGNNGWRLPPFETKMLLGHPPIFGLCLLEVPLEVDINFLIPKTEIALGIPSV